MVNWILYIIFQLLLTVYNIYVTNKISTLLLANGVMFIASVIGLIAFTLLYYYIVSSDAETLLVGVAGVQIGTIFIVILTLISLLVRIIQIRINKKLEN